MISSDWSQLVDSLRQAGNPDHAQTMAAYMRNHFDFLGLKAPQRRALTADYLTQKVQVARQNKSVDWEWVWQAWQAPEREFQYVALDYLNRTSSWLKPEDLTVLRTLVESKSWWDTIDVLRKPIGHLVQTNPDLKEVMLAWAQDENFWVRRIAIIHQLHFKEVLDTQLLDQILTYQLGQTEFFICKAMGWALRDYSKTDPLWVSEWIQDHREDLAPLTIREGSKYLNQ